VNYEPSGSARALPITVIGLVVTIPQALVLVVVETGVFTGGFFAAHTVASGWVSAAVRKDRAQASSLYLFSYYLGGSVAGGLGGVVYSVGGWTGTVAFVGALLLAALFLAALLVKEPAAGRICAVA
jgi:YNFM family putative membrane transporter